MIKKLYLTKDDILIAIIVISIIAYIISVFMGIINFIFKT